MYYEESKKNLMALLRQNGCPSVFLTLSCAEFDWPELLKEIVETVERKRVSQEYIDNLSDREKNKLITDNVVQSTLHFQKRIDKMFSLMQHDFFKGEKETYHVTSYFYRIEFQQRGAPHVHSLLWLKNQDNEEAPNFWIDPSEFDQNEDESKKTEKHQQIKEERIKKMEQFADLLISTSAQEIRCDEHGLLFENDDLVKNCNQCQTLKEKVEKYQRHKHTFTCAKKKKNHYNKCKRRSR